MPTGLAMTNPLACVSHADLQPTLAVRFGIQSFRGICSLISSKPAAWLKTSLGRFLIRSSRHRTTTSATTPTHWRSTRAPTGRIAWIESEGKKRRKLISLTRHEHELNVSNRLAGLQLCWKRAKMARSTQAARTARPRTSTEASA